MSDRTLAVILLAVAAVAAYHYPPPAWLLLIGVSVAWVCWLWLCRHHPLIAIVIHGFLRGLLGGRR